jgi:hypothetical protein
MNREKKSYFLKLNPPRPTFVMDMNEEEKGIMQAHIGYWSDLLSKGVAIVYGPVFDPIGAYGVGVVTVDSEEELALLIESDPANGLNRYDFFPMQAVFSKGESS